jgi:hypothetical protein
MKVYQRAEPLSKQAGTLNMRMSPFRLSKTTLVWSCQYFTFEVPATMHITNVKLAGKYVYIDVWYVVHPQIIVFK